MNLRLQFPLRKISKLESLVFLLISVVVSSILITYQLKQDLYLCEQTKNQYVSKLEHKSSSSTAIKLDRIGTNPKTEIIPRFFRLFQSEGINLDPYPCLTEDGSCEIVIEQQGTSYPVIGAQKLELHFTQTESQLQNEYYERILSIFESNNYQIGIEKTQRVSDLLPYFSGNLPASTILSKSRYISHPEKNIVCTVLNEINGSLTISCIDIDEQVQTQIDLLREIKSDIGDCLAVDTISHNYAIIQKSNMFKSLIEKVDGNWVEIESAGINDINWNSKRLNREFGVPISDGKILSGEF